MECLPRKAREIHQPLQQKKAAIRVARRVKNELVDMEACEREKSDFLTVLPDLSVHLLLMVCRRILNHG